MMIDFPAGEDALRAEADAARTLDARARRLAPAPRPTEGGAEIEVLVCSVHDERYAVELRHLQAVVPGAGLAPLPCVPAHVAGLLNVRGDVIVVLDLAAALALGSRSAPPDRAQVLLVERPGARVGLLVDEVLGVRRLTLDRLDRPLASRESVRGVAEASIVVLEIEHLLAVGQLEVLEEVG